MANMVRQSREAKSEDTPPPARILVVEDERIVALDITMTLRNLGYDIAGSVASGEDAIAIALAFDKHPDLVLMDIRLAGNIDGVSASKAIVDAIDVPIIFLTAHSDAETLRRVQSSKPYSYLLKPFRTEDLRCAIEVTLNRHAADRELRVQEKWLRTTLNTIRDGIVATDETNRVKYLNPMAATMTGWPSEDAIGRQLTEIVTLVNLVTRDAMDLAKDVSKSRETAVISTTGQDWPVEPAATKIPDDRGRTLGRVVVLRDVSETRKALKEIERLNASLEMTVAERTHELLMVNKDLDAFSYSLAHDLRSPLRAIDGYTQSVLEDYGSMLSPECTGRLVQVQDTAKRTSQLITELLQVARLSKAKPNMQQVDLSMMATEIGAELQMASDRSVQFIVAPDIVVTGDHALLHVILANLLSNAWKFSAKRVAQTIEFGVVRDPKPETYFVRDNGVGFDANRTQEMLGIFQRLHGEDFPGDGIGMALVDRAVKKMHGRIWVESQPDQGAIFFFQVESTIDPLHN